MTLTELIAARDALRDLITMAVESDAYKHEPHAHDAAFVWGRKEYDRLDALIAAQGGTP
jgi:hypothetical protein